MALAVFAVFAIIMRYLAAGRAVYATGSDPDAAWLVGVRPRRVVFGVFVLMGALTGLAAVLGAVKLPQVDPRAGDGLELQVIAAVVVGGVAISGGRGTLPGMLFGVALLAVIHPALLFLGAQVYWSKALEGAIILIAVASDAFDFRRRKNALSSSQPSAGETAASEASITRRFRLTHELVLATVLIAEIAIFCVIGKNFMSWQNAFEITRLLVEVGLLALAMTPVIVTGGIDLSVGSLMGLSAVLFGMMWDSQHANLPDAAGRRRCARRRNSRRLLERAVDHANSGCRP